MIGSSQAPATKQDIAMIMAKIEKLHDGTEQWKEELRISNEKWAKQLKAENHTESEKREKKMLSVMAKWKEELHSSMKGWKEEIERHFDVVIENAFFDLRDAGHDQVEMLEDARKNHEKRISRLEQHADIVH